MPAAKSTPFVETVPFCATVAVATLLNILAIGLEVDFGCMGCEPEERVGAFFGVDAFFAVLFGAELAIRIIMGRQHFFVYEDPVRLNGRRCYLPRIPNLFDTLLVLSRILALATSSVQGLEGLKLVSMLRVYHCAAVFKSVRLSLPFREIVLILDVVPLAAKLLVFFIVLVLPTIWATAIVMTITIGQDEEAAERIDYGQNVFTNDDFWGTVPRSAFTLFQIITLDGWSSGLATCIYSEYPVMVFVIVSFLGVTFFSMANVQISTVVASTLAAAKALDNERFKEKEAIRKRVMDSLQLIFAGLDKDKSGELDPEELQSTLGDPDVKDRLALLGLPVSDLEWVFQVLDEEEESGIVNLEMFFRSCTRLDGPAMAKNLQSMSVDFGRSIARTGSLDGHMSNTNTDLRALLDTFDDTDREVIKGNQDDKDPVLANRRKRGKSNGQGGPAAALVESVRKLQRARTMSKLSGGGGGSRRNSRSKSRAWTAAGVGFMQNSKQHAVRYDEGEERTPPISPAQTRDHNSAEREALKGSLLARFGDMPPPPPPMPKPAVRRRGSQGFLDSGERGPFPDDEQDEVPAPPPLGRRLDNVPRPGSDA